MNDATKERQILMCGEMVRATLSGFKTNTRRAIYKSLVTVLHPDRRGSDVEFKQLQAAMEVLDQ